jgi:hypothetical protein
MMNRMFECHAVQICTELGPNRVESDEVKWHSTGSQNQRDEVGLDEMVGQDISQ